MRLRMQFSLLGLVALPATLLAVSLSMLAYKRTADQVPMFMDFGYQSEGTAWRLQRAEQAWGVITSRGWPFAYEWTPGDNLACPPNHRSHGVDLPNLVIDLSLGACVVLLLFWVFSWWVHRGSPSKSKPFYVTHGHNIMIMLLALLSTNAGVAFYRTSQKMVPRHIEGKDDGTWTLVLAVPDSEVVIRSLGWPMAFFWGPFPDAQESLPHNHRSYYFRWPSFLMNQLLATLVTAVGFVLVQRVYRRRKQPNPHATLTTDDLRLT